MIRYLILDVDGTLTDGGIYYDETGNEMKKFNTKDAAGIFAARAADIEVMVLTGRECKATTRRLTELGLNAIQQNIKDKTVWLKEWMKDENIKKDEVGYIGDDLNDLMPMKLCGYIGCPSDACIEVKEISDYVSTNKGGYGAVREIIEHYLREKKIWNDIVEEVYG